MFVDTKFQQHKFDRIFGYEIRTVRILLYFISKEKNAHRRKRDFYKIQNVFYARDICYTKLFIDRLLNNDNIIIK